MLKTEEGFFDYVTMGEFHSEGDWIHPTRVIDTHELIFVTEGRVCINEDGNEYTLARNECILLEPHKQHGGREYSGMPTAFYWLHFGTDAEIPFKIYKGDEYHDIKYLLKKLLHMSKTPVYRKSAQDAAALLVFSELKSVSEKTAGNSLANKIAEYIRINAGREITVREIAERYGYNVDYIGKLFKKSFGTGIKKYIAEERMKLARDCLLNTDLSVKEIAAQMGFEDENCFIKFFSYHDEISPARFRNSYFNIHMNNK